MAFYETDRRPESWAKLKFLKISSSLPWLVIGDFNEIIGLSEKEGGRIRPNRQMELFLEVINFCALINKEMVFRLESDWIEP